jgi:hypothetical protein
MLSNSELSEQFNFHVLHLKLLEYNSDTQVRFLVFYIVLTKFYYVLVFITTKKTLW